MASLPPISKVLPPPARERLVQASQTPIPANDPLARVKAIEKAIEWARFNYPHYFIKDKTP